MDILSRTNAVRLSTPLRMAANCGKGFIRQIMLNLAGVRPRHLLFYA